MGKLQVGSVVKLKKSHAKWHLEHPEIYFDFYGNLSPDYEPETLLHLLACMDHPVTGTLVEDNDNLHMPIFLAEFKVAGIKMSYWVTTKEVEAYNG